MAGLTASARSCGSRHLPHVAEPPGVNHHPAEAGQARPAGHDRLGIGPGGNHRVRGCDAAPVEPQLPATAGPVDPQDPGAQPQPHPRGIVLQVGHVVIAGRKRPATVRDPRAGLMGEHPVSVQAKMVMAFLPGRGHRTRLIYNERVKTSPADRPSSRQAGRASANDHHVLIHGASVYRSQPAVNTTHPPLPPARARARQADISRLPRALAGPGYGCGSWGDGVCHSSGTMRSRWCRASPRA